MTIPDDTLMAFADGTLPTGEAASIASAVAADAALAERVALLRAGRAAARGAFADVLEEPIPARLLAAARGAAPAPVPTRAALPGTATPQPAERRLPFPPRGRIGLAIAASLLLGLVGGWMLRGGGDGGPDPGPGHIGPALAALLERSPSGVAGPATVLATHPIESGGVCRLFAMPAVAATVTGLACRAPSGEWQMRALVARRDGVGGFAPAGADDPLLAEMLERLGAAAAMPPEAERAAIGRGWRPAP